MNLKEQVCSLELAKRLKELGVKQKSLFYWDICKYDDGDGKEDFIIDLLFQENIIGGIRNFYISAFTVAELGEILTSCEMNDKKVGAPYSYRRTKNDNKWWCMAQDWMVQPEREDEKHYALRKYSSTTSDTEADARAKCLIYFIENKLITL